MSLWVRLPHTRDDEYECRNCSRQYEVQHHVCPNCASFCVDTTADVERSYETTYL